MAGPQHVDYKSSTSRTVYASRCGHGWMSEFSPTWSKSIDTRAERESDHHESSRWGVHNSGPASAWIRTRSYAWAILEKRQWRVHDSVSLQISSLEDFRLSSFVDSPTNGIQGNRGSWAEGDDMNQPLDVSKQESGNIDLTIVIIGPRRRSPTSTHSRIHDRDAALLANVN
ncbi:hypothetical protein RRF57_003330 [Xylaria bambusicola]|uniref:Uncharacterized protein n=1 Tax=Xylaria bambusicola TaxID=326684 RepID=A0AAN7U7X2_9PEZI